MSPRILIATALLSSACYSQDQYLEESSTARCALYEECGWLSYVDAADYDECVEILSSADKACASYSPQAAQICVDELLVLSCSDYESGSFPTACLDACTSE